MACHSALMSHDFSWLDMSVAELTAMVIDGELQSLADSYCPIDWPTDEQARLAMALPSATSSFVLIGLGAAWVWGCRDRPPTTWEIAPLQRVRTTPRLPARTVVRDVRWKQHDVVILGNRRVTTPGRTILDIARYETRVDERDLLLVLAQLGRWKPHLLADVGQQLLMAPHLPYKARALRRIEGAQNIVEKRVTYPSLTR